MNSTLGKTTVELQAMLRIEFGRHSDREVDYFTNFIDRDNPIGASAVVLFADGRTFRGVNQMLSCHKSEWGMYRMLRDSFRLARKRAISATMSEQLRGHPFVTNTENTESNARARKRRSVIPAPDRSRSFDNQYTDIMVARLSERKKIIKLLGGADHPALIEAKRLELTIRRMIRHKTQPE